MYCFVNYAGYILCRLFAEIWVQPAFGVSHKSWGWLARCWQIVLCKSAHIGLVFYPGFRQIIGSVDWVQKKKEVQFGKITIPQTTCIHYDNIIISISNIFSLFYTSLLAVYLLLMWQHLFCFSAYYQSKCALVLSPFVNFSFGKDLSHPNLLFGL